MAWASAWAGVPAWAPAWAWALEEPFAGHRRVEVVESSGEACAGHYFGRPCR
jgi:hypothetical protein